MLTFIVASMLMKLDGVGMQGYKGCRVAGIQGGGGGANQTSYQSMHRGCAHYVVRCGEPDDDDDAALFTLVCCHEHLYNKIACEHSRVM